MRRFSAWLAALLLSSSVAGRAEPGPRPVGRVHLDLPVYDVPFNTIDGWSGPSMQQSLMLSKDTYGLVHFAIDRLHPREATTGEVLGILGFDFMMTWFPLSDSWAHEEWHRAVMTRRGVDSHDDVYDLELFAETIAVSQVRDGDLVRMKRDHPADFVRLPEAGIEGQSELVLQLEKDAFFRRSRTFNLGVYWLSKVNSIAYVMSTAGSDADDLTDEINERDGADVERRDFTGLDFTAWVYDLHRPDEPYDARGVHPSGVGIDRYIRYSDLTQREARYLRLQGYLQLVNLLDPALIGMRWFPLEQSSPETGGLTWMASAYHLLTPFGFDLGANLWVRDPRGGIALRLHGYSSGDHPVLPGIELEGIDLRACLGNLRLFFSPRLLLWLQPEGLRYEGTGVRPGILGGLRAGLPLGPDDFRVYLEGDVKTEGWVAGNVDLERAATGRAGLEWVLF